MKTHARAAALAAAVTLVAGLGIPAGAAAGQTDPPPPQYGVPQDPEVLYIKAPDGADMYVELYRPITGPTGDEPPARYPVIFRMDAYEGSQYPGSVRLRELTEETKPFSWQVRDRFVPKGYAFALGHVYGTGNSEGCFQMYGPDEMAATSAVIEALASAPWSTGRIGMFGSSYDGGEALQVAARGSEEARDHLDAVVAFDGPPSLYELYGRDGVSLPDLDSSLTFAPVYAAAAQLPAVASPRGEPDLDPQGAAARQVGACRAEQFAAAADFERTGDFARYFADRSALSTADQVQTPTLMVEGLWDPQENGAISAEGFFDQIPKKTPHKLILGQWQHGLTPSWILVNFWQRVEDWYARFLLGHETGVEDWPQVQVNDSTGAWRAEKDWPSTGGPLGQLALSGGTENEAQGDLGATSPSGSTKYQETRPTTSLDLVRDEGLEDETREGRAIFSTGPLPGPLHIAGIPVLDLWVQLEWPDAHFAVQLEAFASDGTRISGTGVVDNAMTDEGENGESRTFELVGYRSARHLDPIREGAFRQEAGKPAPVGRPVHVPVRFLTPMDMVVPQGGELRIEISGSNIHGSGPSSPSGSPGEVEILHDCAHPSALRFVMPKADPEWLGALSKRPYYSQWVPIPGLPAEGLRDGGGLATARVCGEKPLDPQEVVERP